MATEEELAALRKAFETGVGREGVVPEAKNYEDVEIPPEAAEEIAKINAANELANAALKQKSIERKLKKGKKKDSEASNKEVVDEDELEKRKKEQEDEVQRQLQRVAKDAVPLEETDSKAKGHRETKPELRKRGNGEDKPKWTEKQVVLEKLEDKEILDYYGKDFIDDLKVIYPDDGKRYGDDQWKSANARLKKFNIRWIQIANWNKVGNPPRDIPVGRKMRNDIGEYLNGKIDEPEEWMGESSPIKRSRINLEILREARKLKQVTEPELKLESDDEVSGEVAPIALAEGGTANLLEQESEREKRFKYYDEHLAEDLANVYGNNKNLYGIAANRLNEFGVLPLLIKTEHGNGLDRKSGLDLAITIKEYFSMDSGTPEYWVKALPYLEKSKIKIQDLEEARNLLKVTKSVGHDEITEKVTEGVVQETQVEQEKDKRVEIENLLARLSEINGYDPAQEAVLESLEGKGIKIRKFLMDMENLSPGKQNEVLMQLRAVVEIWRMDEEKRKGYPKMNKIAEVYTRVLGIE